MSRTMERTDAESYGFFVLNSSPITHPFEIEQVLLSDDNRDQDTILRDATGVQVNQMDNSELGELHLDYSDNDDNEIQILPVETNFDFEDPDLDNVLCNIDMANEKENNSENERPKEQNKRFKNVTEEICKTLEDQAQSSSTKRYTKWAVSNFEEWCIESGLPLVDFSTVDSKELAQLLRQFYAGVSPKNVESRKKIMTDTQAKEYQKNSLKNIRAALNRKLKDVGREIDIVRDKEFTQANKLLNGKLKEMVKNGSSRPTKHKKIIVDPDLQKITMYLPKSDDPEILMFKVWYSLAIHFVSRGLEFHQQLTLKSFEFITDEVNREYVTLCHEVQEKNMQGGISDVEAPSDKRMYATGDFDCPVKTLKLFLSHCNPDAQNLFCRPLKTPVSKNWYTLKPISKRMFSEFMQKISKNSNCSQMYTAHCLRATAISMLSDAGFQLHHIMLMSGHRNEASVRSYSRDCSATQKRNISDTLSNNIQSNSSVSLALPAANVPDQPLPPVSSLNRVPSSLPQSIVGNIDYNQENVNSMSLIGSRGFLTHCSFSQCSFSFVMGNNNM